MDQNDAKMTGATGLRISAHPYPGMCWVTTTIWSEKSGRYVAFFPDGPGSQASLMRIADMPAFINEYVQRPD